MMIKGTYIITDAFRKINEMQVLSRFDGVLLGNVIY